MRKLLAILGPSILAISSASIVNIKNINSYHNSEKLSNNLANAEQGTKEFVARLETSKFNNGSGDPVTGKLDAGVTNWESFIADLRKFVNEKNILSFKVTEFSSKFDQLNFSGHNRLKFANSGLLADFIHDLAFGKNIENLKQTVEIRHVGYGNYSWKIKLSVEIDGRKYEDINLNTYETKQYFNNYQILGGFVNNVKIAYDAEPKSIDDRDNEFNSNITLKNLGFYWYVNQILDSFNKWDYNNLALDYINVRKGHNLDQIKATAVKRAERNSDGYFKVASEVNSGYNLNDKVVDEYFYVSLQSDYAEGIFEMLVKNVNL